MKWFKKFYSVLKASTGFFFAAILDGINPAIKVSTTLSIIKETAVLGLTLALNPLISSDFATSLLIGTVSAVATATPRTPDVNPRIFSIRPSFGFLERAEFLSPLFFLQLKRISKFLS